MKDELTSKMHEEFSVDPAVEREHTIMSAQLSVESGNMTREEALKWYKITEEEFSSLDLSKPAGKRLRK
jgi:hypothetical protein